MCHNFQHYRIFGPDLSYYRRLLLHVSWIFHIIEDSKSPIFHIIEDLSKLSKIFTNFSYYWELPLSIFHIIHFLLISFILSKIVASIWGFLDLKIRWISNFSLYFLTCSDRDKKNFMSTIDKLRQIHYNRLCRSKITQFDLCCYLKIYENLISWLLHISLE